MALDESTRARTTFDILFAFPRQLSMERLLGRTRVFKCKLKEILHWVAQIQHPEGSIIFVRSRKPLYEEDDHMENNAFLAATYMSRNFLRAILIS
jgi:hypothetical protein